MSNEYLLRQFQLYHEAKGSRDRTVGFYRQNLRYLMDYALTRKKRISELDRPDIREYILRQKERGNRPATINARIRAYRAFYHWAVGERVLTRNPMEGIPFQRIDHRKKPPLSRVQMDMFLRSFHCKDFHSTRNYILALLLFEALMRRSEAARLQWQDVKIGEKMIRVSEESKGRRERFVPISYTFARLLHRFKMRYCDFRIPGDSVISSEGGQPIRVDHINKILTRQAARQLNFHVAPHMLRVTGASFMSIQGVPAEVLQRLLGHTDIRVTQTYMRSLTADVIAAAQKYSPRNLISGVLR